MAALGLITYLGVHSPWPDGGAPQRLEVRIESRPAASALSAQAKPVSPVADESAKSSGNASTGSLVTTPPELVGEVPLLIEGAPGAARLLVEVDAGGKVTAIRVEKSTLEPATEREMIERMRVIRFRPASENGKPTAGRLDLEVRVESVVR